jgi:hypothetical protein
MTMLPPSGPKKQTQTKPKQTQLKACPECSRMGQFAKGQNELKIACRKFWIKLDSSINDI